MVKRDLVNGIDSTDLTEGQIVAAKVNGTDVVLVRHEGRVCALSGMCTHLKAPLSEGILVDGTIRCPWHHARFDVATGEAVGAPAFQPLAKFELTEEDGVIRVGAPSSADIRVSNSSAPEMGQIVIVGAGAAGHACAEMLARHGAGASVTLISDEADAPYDRTFCSKQYLAGKADRDGMTLPTMDGVILHTGVRVAAIMREDKKVAFDDGVTLPYDTLILATGAEPLSPDFYGAERNDVYVVRTVSDADHLITASTQATRAIVVGSSYIGLEVAASLIARGLEVSVISDTELPLQKTAGNEVGVMVRDLHRAKGVTFYADRHVARWDGSVATLDDGTRVEGDLIVAGIGVTPRLELAQAAGLLLAEKADGGGVQVDDHLRTSDAAIHAIGDIASAPDRRLGRSIRVEHWVVAQRMGQWLARHLLGQVSAGYDDAPFFWSSHYDLSLRYVGHVASPEDRIVEGDVSAQDFAVHFKENGREQALLTAGRDRLSLEREQEWEKR